MIQIKGFFGANTAEAIHGSGFAVARVVYTTRGRTLDQGESPR